MLCPTEDGNCLLPISKHDFTCPQGIFMPYHDTAELVFRDPSFYPATTSEPTNCSRVTTGQREVADAFLEAKRWKFSTYKERKDVLYAELSKINNKNTPSCVTCKSYPKSVCKMPSHSPGFIPSFRHHVISQPCKNGEHNAARTVSTMQ